MPVHYQQKRMSQYLLPSNLYRRVIYTIKDYDRLKQEYQAVLESSRKPNVSCGTDGRGRPVAEYVRCSGAAYDPTAEKGVKLAMMSDEIHAIERALEQIPKEYRDGVFGNIRYGAAYPDIAHYHTWQKWRQRFVYFVASKLGYV